MMIYSEQFMEYEEQEATPFEIIEKAVAGSHKITHKLCSLQITT